MKETEGCTVLVVSDLPAWYDFIKNGLARGGRPHDQVRLAASGNEGLAAAEQDLPDLIIYFLWTFGMNGYEFCQKIKTIPAFQKVPVLLVGATSPNIAYPAAQRVGAAGYLRHPDREQDLVAARDAVLKGLTYYPPTPRQSPPSQQEKATIKKGCKVLLVDDEPELLELIQFILRHRRDDSVRYVNSGQRGLMVAEQDPPDLIILDIMMPDIDGFEVCRQLKGMPALWNVPVLFQTARTAADVIPEAKRLGAAGCINEPYGPQELLAARDAVLRGETYYPPFEIGKSPL
jgi:CheY-like chemotaxis protein